MTSRLIPVDRAMGYLSIRARTRLEKRDSVYVVRVCTYM